MADDHLTEGASASAEAALKATQDILRVISNSRDDERPVFQAILDSAIRLCDADSGSLMLIDDRREHTVLKAMAGLEWGFEVDVNKWPLDLGHAQTEAARTGEVVHEVDLKDSDIYRGGDETRVRLVDEIGLRTALAVPLLMPDGPIGVIVLHRVEVARAFSDDDIGLLESFAAQAVIAIENARQFREAQERLERERASAEILDVISRSRDDDRPVFQTIVEQATRLAGSDATALVLGQTGVDVLTLGAHVGAPEDGVRKFERGEVPFDPEQSLVARAIHSGEVLHLPDMKETEDYKSGAPVTTGMVNRSGVRSALFVPLMASGLGVGALALFRNAMRPFISDEIALVETFAAQAVIAIENVRQFREVQERLERERASAEILEVISTSRDDEDPVFDAILDNARRLCEAPFAGLYLVDEDRTQASLVASPGAREDYLEGLLGGWTLDEGASVPTAIRTGEIVHIEDLADTDLYREGDEKRVRAVDVEGIRTFLALPLLDKGEAVGCIGLYRREVRPFSANQIDLLKTFAAQAVIAIENVRQFREVQERLEREEASRDILEVISQSRDDENPVFDVILRQASRLCDAPLAGLLLGTAEVSHQRLAAQIGARPEVLEMYRDDPPPMDPEVSITAEAIISKRVIHEPDLTATRVFKSGSRFAKVTGSLGGIRTCLWVPLISGSHAIGAITLYRTVVQPFSEDDVQMVEAFAAQAVIAIENVRQFREVQERLERERASAEILEVISTSREDDAPVFDVILKRASELCRTSYAGLALINEAGTHLVYTASHGPALAHSKFGDMQWALDGETSFAEAVRERRPVQIEDMKESALYKAGDPQRVAHVDGDGIRTFMAVPMFQNEEVIGAFGLARFEVSPFSSDDIELVKTFAAQAVIAIENVRQFKALETLNAELGDRVESQVGEIERMGRLKRFLPSAVADAVVTSGDESMLTSHRALVATLFCDMRGFTAFCESAEPEETIEVLQTYHQEMSDLIDKYGGGVDQRAGDGIMVIFNDPIPIDDPAGDAVRLAVAMREKMKELCAGWKRLGYRLGFGVGVSLGYATVGMVGSAGRFDYTASGTSVNTAARLCDMAADGEILISPRVWIAVEGEVQAESRGEVEMKGIREPVEVFSVQ